MRRAIDSSTNLPQIAGYPTLLITECETSSVSGSACCCTRCNSTQELPKFREMLADNEIIPGNVSVSDQSHTKQQTKQTDQQHK